MTETDLRRWLIKKLKNEEVMLQPIESGAINIGILDIYFCTKKSGGWIELKIGHVTKRNELKLRWEPGQLNWIKRHAELNGKTFLLIGINPDLIQITRLNALCVSHKGFNNESATAVHYINSMSLTSGEHIMHILDS